VGEYPAGRREDHRAGLPHNPIPSALRLGVAASPDGTHCFTRSPSKLAATESLDSLRPELAISCTDMRIRSTSALRVPNAGTCRAPVLQSRLGRYRRRQARDDFCVPLNHLGALRLGLQRCLEVLDHGLKLLVRQLLDRIAVLDFVLAPD